MELPLAHQLASGHDPVSPVLDLQAARARGAVPTSLSAPIYVLWDMTYRCPLRCLTCFNSSGGGTTPETSRSEALDIARQLAASGVLAVCMSGGEALLHPATFDCARLLRSAGVEVNTITNGWLVSDRMADQMTACFRAVEVSVDGACAQTHDYVRGRAGSYNRAIGAIRRLTDRGIRVTVAFTPIVTNMAEFPRLVAMMSTFPGVQAVVTGYVMPTGRAYQNPEIPSMEAQDRFREQVRSLKRVYDDRLRVSFNDPLESVRKQFDASLPNLSLEIGAGGQLMAGPWLPIVFGNALRDGLIPVWERRLAHIWTDPLVRKFAGDFHSVQSLASQERIAWVDQPVHYDELTAGGDQNG